MARPRGTTKRAGYKASPGRPKGTTVAKGYKPPWNAKTGYSSFIEKVVKGAEKFFESPFTRRT